MFRRRRRERGEEPQLASEANTTKWHADMLSREMLFSNLGAAGADNAVGLGDFVIRHYKPMKDWRTERLERIGPRWSTTGDDGGRKRQ
jgi:hypothetical protein